MTIKELMNILSSLDPDTKIAVEGRDSTGEYSDYNEMTEKNLYIDDGLIIIFAD